MEVDYYSDTADSRAVKNERKKQIKQQMVKVLGLTVILLFFLPYLLITNLPTLLPVRGVKFVFSIYSLREPSAVTIDDDGRLYVSEPVNHRVLIFDANGDLVKRLTPVKGKGRVSGVYGSAIDESKNRIYIADFVQRAVHVFNKQGKFLFRFPNNALARTYGENGFVPLDIELYKNRVFVTTRNGIAIFNDKGKLQETWGKKRGKVFGQFDFPNGIAINQKTGDIYVADTLNRRVVAMSQKGKVKWAIGKPDKASKLSSFFSLPKGIVLDDEGRIIVADSFEHRVVVLSPDGALVSIFGSRGVEDAKFNFPEGLAYNNGRLIVSDKGNARVQVFTIGGLLPKPPKRKGVERSFQNSFFKLENNAYLGSVERVRYVNEKPAPGQKI